MPPKRVRQPNKQSRRDFNALVVALSIVGILATSRTPAQANGSRPILIRCARLELHYQLEATGSPAEIQLWYTRDRGVTWHMWGVDEDQSSPIVFVAPAEGLYGFTLIARNNHKIAENPPQPHDPPQRWALIDYTPPLAQWDQVEPADNFATKPVLRLRWTAHDDHLASRPISLWYHASIDQKWHPIEQELPNAGWYDWSMPENLSGQITLKLIVRDEAGHTVERTFGPKPVEHWRTSAGTTAPATTTDPASPPPQKTQPQNVPVISFQKRQEAEELYRKGSWHLIRDQYALAAERFREALECNPNMLAAMNDLAGIHYLQQDYDQALELYQSVLQRDGKHPLALRGTALAYLSQRKYPQARDMWQKLLAVDKKNAATWMDLGDVMFLMGDRANAQDHWRQATQVDRSAQAVIQKARSRLKLYGTTPPSTTTNARR